MCTVLQSLAAVAVFVGVGSVPGCVTGETKISGGRAALAPGENSAAFLDRISSQDHVSENDAMRGILMVLAGQDTAATFQQRVRALREKKIIPVGGNFDANRPIGRGKLAYMIYQACKFPGGLILRLTGPSQRYCLRELQYRGMMMDGFASTPVDGMEFVAALTRADVYKRTGKVPDRAGQIEGE